MAAPREPNSETRIDGVPRPEPGPDDLDSTRWDGRGLQEARAEAEAAREAESEEEDDDVGEERGLTTRWDFEIEPPPEPPPTGKTTRWGVERPKKPEDR